MSPQKKLETPYFQFKESSLIEIIFDAVPDAIFVKDSQHRWIYGNLAFEKILNLKRDQFYGKSDYDIFPKEIAEIFWKGDDLVFNSGIESEQEEQIKLADGTIRTILTKKTPIIQDSGEKWLVGVIRDITERKRSESILAQQSKLASLGEMAGGVAHEINNPLAIILGTISQLNSAIQGQPHEASIDLSLAKLRKHAERISKIVNGLKTISRNSDEDAMNLVRLSNIIDDATELSRERFKAHGLNFTTDVAPTHYVLARGSQIAQVILNLLNNSFDAITENGTRKDLNNVWITLKSIELADRVQILITDSGNGILPEHISRLMQPFYTTKPTGKGTGLGLSISKSIIESHHGKLFYNPNSSNTQFIIELPKEMPKNSEAKPV